LAETWDQPIPEKNFLDMVEMVLLYDITNELFLAMSLGYVWGQDALKCSFFCQTANPFMAANGKT
jgi:hypothetical protein